MGKKVEANFPLDLGVLGLPNAFSFLLPEFSAIAVGPHMHQLGKEIRGDLELADGTEIPLIYIDNWDFHWQGAYFFKEPVTMPYGSRIKLTCVFDNTTDRHVRWGESSEDEMCLMFVGFTAEGGLSGLLFGSP
jgi:hypothetical protein